MHYCGNPIHDIIVNLYLLFTVCPEWLPYGVTVKSWAMKKIDGLRHHHVEEHARSTDARDKRATETDLAHPETLRASQEERSSIP